MTLVPCRAFRQVYAVDGEGTLLESLNEVDGLEAKKFKEPVSRRCR
jgi:hypothetical protein